MEHGADGIRRSCRLSKPIVDKPIVDRQAKACLSNAPIGDRHISPTSARTVILACLSNARFQRTLSPSCILLTPVSTLLEWTSRLLFTLRLLFVGRLWAGIGR